MDKTQKETVEWFVIFNESQLDHWLLKRLPKKFQHCYAMKKSDGGQFWVVVNPMSSHTSVTMELVDDYPHPRLYAGIDSVIVPIRVTVVTDRYRHTLCVFNCVEVVKSLLGICDFWLWTPHQLYKRLRG